MRLASLYIDTDGNINAYIVVDNYKMIKACYHKVNPHRPTYPNVTFNGEDYASDSMSFYGYRKHPRYQSWQKIHTLVQEGLNEMEEK